MKKTYETPLLLCSMMTRTDVIMLSQDSELNFDVGDLIGGGE